MKKKLQAEMSKLLKNKRLWQALKFISLSLAGSLCLILTAFHFAYRGRIYPGVMAADQPIGNRTVAEAAEIINQRVSALIQPKLILSSKEQNWTINLAEVDFNYDATATAKKAFQIGRQANLINNFLVKTKAWFSGINLDLEYQLDQKLLEDQINTIASQVFIPTINPQVKIINTTVVVEQGQAGQELDRRQLASLLNSHLQNYNFTPIELPLLHPSFLLTEAETTRTQQRAEKFLGKELILRSEDETWTWQEETLVDCLSFSDGFDKEKISSQAANLALAINRQPQNATFQFSGGKVSQFQPALDGLKLDEEKTRSLIESALERIEKSEETEPISLPIATTPPQITIAQVNDLGIKELLGQGISYFWGSIPSRIHNIVLASSNLNGILVAPGETFSLNQTLGEVSPATGYQSAFIIKEGRTILGDGGGVCQVSTTLFRAILNAGLPVLERHPHSYRVSYYEQGGFGPGLDATVWMPGIDLKFKNDTAAHILIQAQANTKNMTLTFDLYGLSDGRQPSLSKPRVWDQTPPPPDLYQDDPTLPAGTVKRIERAIWGAKAAVDWRVVRGDEVLQERTFYSNYQPWQAIYLRGTGS